MNFDLLTAIKDVGFPITVSLYLLYVFKDQNKFYGSRLDDIKDILTDMTTQISYMLSANMSYRAGNIEAGDMMSRQAIYVGNRAREDREESGGDIQ